MNTLFVIGNINMKTVELVSQSLQEDYKDGFETIVLFQSKESKMLESEQEIIYRRYFGNFIKEVIQLDFDGTIPTDKIFTAFSRSGNKVVDLSNGQKVTTVMLYMAAVLCHIDNIHHLQLHTHSKETMSRGEDFDYIRIERMKGYDKLSQIGFFDLIYYMDQVNLLFNLSDRNKMTNTGKIYCGLMEGIAAFFSNNDYRTVINNVVLGNESFIQILREYVSSNEECKRFCKAHKIYLNQKDDLGALNFFFKKYLKHGQNSNLTALCTVPGLLSALREYRNISSHYSTNKFHFTEDDARTAINMQINVTKIINRNEELWDLLKK